MIVSALVTLVFCCCGYYCYNFYFGGTQKGRSSGIDKETSNDNDKINGKQREKQLLDALQGAPGDWEMFKDRTLREKALTRMAVKRGKTFKMFPQGSVKSALMQDVVVATCSPKFARELFLKKVHTAKRANPYRMARFLPGMDGVLFQDGEIWEKHIRALLPVFHAKNFDGFSKPMFETAASYASGWQGSCPLDCLNALSDINTSIILQSGYGVDPESNVGKDLFLALRAYDEKATLRAAGSNPLRIVGGLWKLWRQSKAIEGVVSRVLREKTRPYPDAQNWLHRMQEAGFSMREIACEANHLHGAQKAFAVITTFALFELAKNPEVQSKMREELRRELFTQGSGWQYPSKAILSRLRYSLSVWKETLRLHPISLGVLRRVGRDVELDEVPVSVPEGTNVEILLYALHTHPDHWGENPLEFEPERWIKADNTSPLSTESDTGIRGAFVPFLDGNRQCQGRFLAELQFASVMTSILSRWKLLPDPANLELTIQDDFYPEPEKPITVLPVALS
eukprot:g1073.t1